MKALSEATRILSILCVLYVTCPLSALSAARLSDSKASFDSARPIWPTDRETEMNLFVGFRVFFEHSGHDEPVLRITASSLYRVYLNGSFIGYGPARGPHGYCRIDEWPLGEHLRARNVLAIEVAGYNVNSYYLLDESAFLQAEVVSAGDILASTAGGGANFVATVLKHRLQRVQRYSFQRPFIEYYRLSEGDDNWWDKPLAESRQASCSIQGPRGLLVRRVAYPRFRKRQPLRIVGEGKLQQNVPVERIWKDRSLVNIGPPLKGYPEEELQVVPSTELQKIQSVSLESVNKTYQPDTALELSAERFSIVDFGTNLSGFILPGGHSTAAWAHICRTVCRRAERNVARLSDEYGEDQTAEQYQMVLIYLNRLSDYLFVVARYCNPLQGVPDTLWKQK